MPHLQHLTVLKRVSFRDTLLAPMSPMVFHQRPDLVTTFKRLRTVPRVDLILKNKAGEGGQPPDWLKRTETSMLGMIERVWKGARNQLRVTVCWELSRESRERQWSFEIVERPFRREYDETGFKILNADTRLR